MDDQFKPGDRVKINIQAPCCENLRGTIEPEHSGDDRFPFVVKFGDGMRVAFKPEEMEIEPC